MTVLDYAATTAGSVAKLAILPAGAVLASHVLLDRLDDRGLFKVQPFPWMPFAAAAALEWVLIRTSGFAQALDPYRVWTEGVWAVDLATLYARQLAPTVLLARAGEAVTALATDPSGHAVALAVLLGASGAIATVAALAWRSVAAWRGLFLQLWLTAAVWLVLHYAIVLVYWIVYWLNFWIFFVLLAFIQMWRKEGPRDKVYPS